MAINPSWNIYDAGTIPDITSSGSYSGVLDYSGDRDLYAISLSAGQSITVAMDGSSVGAGTLSDPYLRLHDAAGTVVAFNDDGGPGYNSLMTYTASFSGTYYISAGDFGDNNSGTFTLTVGTTTTVTPPVVVSTGTLTNGNDTYSGTNFADTVTGLSGNDFISTFGGNDLVYGNQDSDTLSGGSGNDSLFGGMSSDYIAAGAGNDFVYGNNENDTMFGGSGNDWMHGGMENDLIFGGVGDDTLQGGLLNDTLSGGGGRDTLYGNSGADNFVFDAADGSDVIADFNWAEGDHIVLNGISGLTQSNVTSFLSGNGSGVVTLNLGGSDTYGGSANTITIYNVAGGSLISSDFIVNPTISGGPTVTGGLFGQAGPADDADALPPAGHPMLMEMVAVDAGLLAADLDH